MSKQDINRPVTLGAAIMLTLVGMNMLHVHPLFVGAVADQLGFSGEQLGMLAGIETTGMGLAALLAVTWIRRSNWRWAASAAICVTIAGHLLTLSQESFVGLLVVRGLTGFLGEGVVLAIGIAMLSETRDTDRAFAIMVMAYVIQIIVGLVLLPHFIGLYGISGLVLPLAGFALLGLLAPYLAPERGSMACSTEQIEQRSGTQGNGPVFWGLAAQLVWYMGITGALWTFIERIGASAGFNATDIGSTLALAMGLSFLGSAIATALSDRFGKLYPFLLTMLVQGLAVLWFLGLDSLLIYTVAWCAINVVWNYGLPYVYAAVADADYSGRYVVTVPTAQTFGAAIGASLAGFLVRGDDYSGVVYFVILTCAGAGILYTVMIRRTTSFGDKEAVEYMGQQRGL